jgi:hypothetical protein
MNPLTRRRHAPFVASQLQQALFQQVGDIDVAAELTHISIHEIHALHHTTARCVAATLRQAKDIIVCATQAGTMTPRKEARIRAETEAYLTRMLRISQAGSAQLTQLLLRSATRR